MITQTLTQPKRRTIRIHDTLIDQIQVGDILLTKTSKELVTSVTTEEVKVLFRENSREIYHGTRKFLSREITSPEYHSINETDKFKERCYQIADQMLIEAGL